MSEMSDMYKISEEDSQDEEVVGSRSLLVTKVTPQVLRVKPIPPAKPAFLRRNVPEPPVIVIDEEEEERTPSPEDHSSCSSCDEGTSAGASDYSSTDHPDDSSSDNSDLDFDSASEYLFEDQLYALISEAEFQDWGRGNGNISLYEYNTSSKAMLYNSQGTSSAAKVREEAKVHKSKISRLLKRGNKSKSEETETRGTKTVSKVLRFKDEHEGEVRKVDLSITSYSKHNLGRRATLLESLVGILPSRFSMGGGKGDSQDNRIMVAGFIPGGEAAKNKQIKIGDCLNGLNGKSVNFGNVNAVLHQILEDLPEALETTPLKISLELQRVSGYTFTDTPTKSVTFGDEEERENAIEEETDLPQDIMSQVALIYISVLPSSKDKSKEVIFGWPKESRKVKALSACHGMFWTLYKLLKDISGAHPISSRVVVEEMEMDVVFSTDDEGSGLLLLATAAELSHFKIPHHISTKRSDKQKQLRWKEPVTGGLAIAHRLMARIEGLLYYDFGSLREAFQNTPEEELCEFLKKALAGLSDISQDLLHTQVQDHWLRVPLRIKSWIDERLYSLEAWDSFYLCDRSGFDIQTQMYNCIGSGLLYKGMTICSHVEKDLASGFHGWWKTQLGYWGVRRHWQPLKRLILWKQTFLPQTQPPYSSEALPADENGNLTPLPCYSGLVGIGDFMVGIILEPATQGKRDLELELGWIKRAFHLLLQILNSHIHTGLEKWILSQENEEFIELYPTGLVPNNANQFSTQPMTATSNIVSGPSSILKNSDNPHPISRSNPTESLSNLSTTTEEEDYSYHYGLSSSAGGAERLDMSFESREELEETRSDSTTGTESDASSMKWLHETQLLSDLSFAEQVKSVSITKGNVLFDFVQVEHGRGVLLSTKQKVEGPFAVILHNLLQSSTVTHHILHKALEGRTTLSGQTSDKKWVSKTLTPISEHGVLFNCDVVDPRDVTKKKPRLRQVSYWVVGRLYPNLREVYVCYQDSSVTQNLLEISFKLAYASAS